MMSRIEFEQEYRCYYQNNEHHINSVRHQVQMQSSLRVVSDA